MNYFRCMSDNYLLLLLLLNDLYVKKYRRIKPF